MMNEQVCGTCRHCKRDKERIDQAFTCHNEESDEYGVMTFFDDECECWEEKE